MIGQIPTPLPPPPSDPLTQALSPIQAYVTQRQKVENVMRKYGKQIPKPQPQVPPMQWEGDNNA